MALNEIGEMTLKNMREGNLLSDDFVIDENLLYEYVKIYDFNVSRMKSKNNGKYDKFFTRKMAGLTLHNELLKSGHTFKTCKSGFVYFITNPAWPKHTKVGLCMDVHNRIKSYQTYDPFRSYKLECYEFVCDRRKYEKIILDEFQVNSSRGEWVPHSKSLHMIRFVRNLISKESKYFD